VSSTDRTGTDTSRGLSFWNDHHTESAYCGFGWGLLDGLRGLRSIGPDATRNPAATGSNVLVSAITTPVLPSTSAISQVNHGDGIVKGKSEKLAC
jgi:hypothetical protein